MVTSALELNTHTDPYTLLASHLREGEASRADLKRLTGLDYNVIEAALFRFATMTSIENRMDSKGVEFYRWKSDVPLPAASEPAAPKPVAKPVAPVDLPSEVPRVSSRRPVGWNLAGEIRSCLDGLEEGSAFGMPWVFDRLLERHPAACETYTSSGLRTQITATLAQWIGKTITRAGVSVDGKTKVYRKMRERDGVKPAKRPYTKRANNTTLPQPKAEHQPERINVIYQAVDVSYQQVIDEMKQERDDLSQVIAVLERRAQAARE